MNRPTLLDGVRFWRYLWLVGYVGQLAIGHQERMLYGVPYVPGPEGVSW